MYESMVQLQQGFERKIISNFTKDAHGASYFVFKCKNVLFKVQLVVNENTQIFYTTNNINRIIITRKKGEKLEFMVSFGGVQSMQVLDKLIVNLLAEHQMLSRFNSSVIVFLRVCELFSVN